MKKGLIFIALMLSAVFCSQAQISEATGEDKTLSPYFFVKSEDPTVDRMPLKDTRADITILGVIADVEIEQVYINNGKKPLEATYLFPGSTRAAVYAMEMQIGERTLIAKIKEKEAARMEYEEAKAEGKSASLLEQMKPNVFQMNVANIMPGDTIRTRLRYTELLIPEEGTYEFVYPTVVGPRYSNTPAKEATASEKWVENPYLHAGEKPPYTFHLQAALQAGMPIKQAASPSHKVNINYESKNTGFIELSEEDKFGGNKDFVLRYRLSGNKIESGLLLHEGEKENFFLAMIQPPKREAVSARPPREYVFIVDISGSMNGFPLETAKSVMRPLLNQLHSKDRFNVMLFAGNNLVLNPTSLKATPQNIQKGLDLVDKSYGSGSTELLPALKNALSLPETENHSRTFVVVTDGYVTVEEEAFDLIRNNLNDANVFAFGIGSSVNRHLIEGMAHVGQGEPFIILNAEEAPAKAEKFRRYIENPVLTNIKVKYDGFDVYDIEPVSIPDVLAERPVIIFGKYKGKAQGKITLTGRSGTGTYTHSLAVADGKKSEENTALSYLWARERIKMLGDYDKLTGGDKRKEEITSLGLKYNLLTAFTSFVAVDPNVRNTEGELAKVDQPLPMPEGVSDMAVGSSSGATFSNNGFTGSAPGVYSKGSRRMSKKSVAREFGAAPKPSISEETDEEVDLETGAAEDEEVFTLTEQTAEPVKGMKSLNNSLKRTLLNYLSKGDLKALRSFNSKEQFIVQFTVQKDGTVSDTKILKGLSSMDSGLKKRFIKAIQKSLNDVKWKPGKQQGQKTHQKLSLPLTLELLK